MEWLDQKVAALSNQVSLNKNRLQDLLLGIVLCLRDLELSCFAEENDDPVPEYLTNSCMVPNDIEFINRTLDSISDVVNDLKYVHLYNWVI